MSIQNLALLVLALVAGLLGGWLSSGLTFKPAPIPTVQEFEMVTGEWEWVSDTGDREIEAYRWDPGVLVVPKGTTVVLAIFGVNGSEHTLSIEAFDIQAVVKRGEVTRVRFVADKAGIFPMVCLNHPDLEHRGPMVGYLVVQ